MFTWPWNVTRKLSGVPGVGFCLWGGGGGGLGGERFLASFKSVQSIVLDSMQNRLIFGPHTAKGTFSVLAWTRCHLILNGKVNMLTFLSVPTLPLLFPLQCSVSCGRGTKRREIACVYQNQTKIDEEICSHLPRPRTEKACRARGCPGWKANRWREVRTISSLGSWDVCTDTSRGCKCRPCTHKAPVQSALSLFLSRNNVSFTRVSPKHRWWSCLRSSFEI